MSIIFKIWCVSCLVKNVRMESFSQKQFSLFEFRKKAFSNPWDKYARDLTVHRYDQKYNRLRYPLEKFSSLFEAGSV